MIKQKDLNSEAREQARKELGVFDHPIYACSPKKVIEHARPFPAPPIVHAPGVVIEPVERRITREGITFVEAAKFSDARAFACLLLGVPEVDIALVQATNGKRPYPRWQVRWTGRAGGAIPVTMQARYMRKRESLAEWINAREL